jgi:hypothetical protein
MLYLFDLTNVHFKGQCLGNSFAHRGKMKQKDDCRQWQTIRADLATHQRATVILTDKEDEIHHIRISGMPETEHKDIYDKLGIKANKNMKKYFIAKRS